MEKKPWLLQSDVPSGHAPGENPPLERGHFCPSKLSRTPWPYSFDISKTRNSLSQCQHQCMIPGCHYDNSWHISANLREACAIQNSDDHLRSHGFFIGVGVRLSSAYDMNRSFDRTQLSLSINEVDTACDFAIAINAYKDYGRELEQAEKVREPLDAAVATGREEVDLLHIPRTEQDPMETVFAHCRKHIGQHSDLNYS